MHQKAKKLMYAGIVFLLLFAVLYTKDEVTLSGNESSRFGVVQAIGEQGVFYIERTNFASTVDKVERNGHIYSDKPLPLSFCAGVIYGAIHRMTGLNFADNRMLSIYLVNLLFSGTCNILLFIWMFNYLRRTSRGKLELKFLLSLAMCLSTTLASYSVMLNNHTPAALALFGMVVALAKYQTRPTVRSIVWAAAAAGIAGALDIPLGIFAGIAVLAGVYLSAPREGRVKSLGAVVITGGVICLGVLLLNFIAYGTIMPLYVAGGGGTFKIVIVYSRLADYVFQSLLGFRGLFSYCPFLLLIFPAVWCLRKKLRISEYCGLGVALAIILFYLLFTNEYGGASYGMRYFIPAIPIFWMVISRWILSWRLTVWKWIPVALLLLYGAVTALVGAYCPFCLANEGARTPERHFSNTIRSPFWGNLLVMSFERDPESKNTWRMIDAFGAENSFWHIYNFGLHTRNPELIAKLLQSSLAKKLGASR
ncbi:MAG: hypothetical protein LBM70_08635 [Victivallales bacterium]|jgi:hypothetical protein|nr:hypothetical protein [Victivallales bacterium]